MRDLQVFRGTAESWVAPALRVIVRVGRVHIAHHTLMSIRHILLLFECIYIYVYDVCIYIYNVCIYIYVCVYMYTNIVMLVHRHEHRM